MPGRSATRVSVILAWFRSDVTPATTTCSMSCSGLVTNVPLPSLNDDLTTTGTSYFLANSTERACRTLAPKRAISSISS